MVREYLELNGFLVRQQRKYVAPTRREFDEIDFFALNPDPSVTGAPLPFILGTENLPGIHRAVVVVKGWHTETFSPSVLSNAPEIFRFVQPENFKRAAEGFSNGGVVTKILVVPALPQNLEARDQSVALLQAKGIDAVIPFRTILADLIRHAEPNRNYQKSDLMQMIRVLKNYDFFKEPQMELFKGGRRGKK
jgi:hypothetical protein